MNGSHWNNHSLQHDQNKSGNFSQKGLMMQAQQCSLQQPHEQTQMQAKFESPVQPHISTTQANNSDTQVQLSSEQDNFGTLKEEGQVQPTDLHVSETNPSVLHLCPTNWHQIPLEQAQLQEQQYSPDLYQAHSPPSHYVDQDRLEQGNKEDESRKAEEDEKRLTEGDNGLIPHVPNHPGVHDSALKQQSDKSLITETLSTLESQTKCTVNQESFEHQTGQVWQRSLLSQATKVQGNLLGQASNKMKGFLQPSNAAALPPSRSKCYPAQGSYPSQGKMPLSHTSTLCKNAVSNASHRTSVGQSTGSSATVVQSCIAAQRFGTTHPLKQVGKSMIEGVTNASATVPVDQHRAATLQTKPAAASGPYTTLNMPGQYQPQMPPVDKHGAATLQTKPSAASGPYATLNMAGQYQPQMPKMVSVIPGVTVQKKAAESVPSMQPPSKKQKLNGDSLDQSIDQLNDVTAVSGVNLREEEEQLLAEPAEKGHASEALKMFVQQEERKLFLEKGPLRQKVVGIANKCGVQSVSEDVERCLSMSMEEWLRSMLYKLIRFSKQQCDFEKDRHKLVITSDTHRQILLTKKKAKEAKEAKEALQQKQAEEKDKPAKLSEKKEKVIEDKSESRAKGHKAPKDDDEKLRVNATNVAARLAVGADDMLIKWQMMAEQARLKREGEAGASDGTTAVETSKTFDATSSKEPEGRTCNGDARVGLVSSRIEPNSGPHTVRAATGRPPGLLPKAVKLQTSRTARLITVKDLIAVLETEPQMAKSTLLYRLYDRNLATNFRR